MRQIYTRDDALNIGGPNLSRILELRKTFFAEQEYLNNLLIIVDPQLCFCHPDYELYVGGEDGYGALDDCVRIGNFILNNNIYFSNILATKDYHKRLSIFFSSFWEDKDGKQPAPFTMILSSEVLSGTWRPSREAQDHFGKEYIEEFVRYYTVALDKINPLVIWPYHALDSHTGRNLSYPILEAGLASMKFLTVDKGLSPLSEQYSALELEVQYDHLGIPLDQYSGISLKNLSETYDKIFICGEAKSHCVLSTIKTLSLQLDNLERVFLLGDCSTSIVSPQMDYRSITAEALVQFEKLGLKIIDSTESLAFLGEPKLHCSHQGGERSGLL